MTPTDAIESLWHDHHVKLLNYVKRRVTVDAEDVAQDVWLSALEAMHQGHGTHTSASGWLYRIARNRMIDGYRHRSRQPQWVWLDEPLEDDEKRTLADTLVCDEAGPHELAEQAETKTQVDAALATLDELPAAVVQWRMAGLEYDEMGQSLKKRSDAVKQIYSRALGQLRIYFGKTPRRKRALPPGAARVRAVLLQHGPQKAQDMDHLAGLDLCSVYRALKTHSHVFVVIGGNRAHGAGLIWGVRGIHDQQEAA